MNYKLEKYTHKYNNCYDDKKREIYLMKMIQYGSGLFKTSNKQKQEDLQKQEEITKYKKLIIEQLVDEDSNNIKNVLIKFNKQYLTSETNTNTKIYDKTNTSINIDKLIEKHPYENNEKSDIINYLGEFIKGIDDNSKITHARFYMSNIEYVDNDVLHTYCTAYKEFLSYLQDSSKNLNEMYRSNKLLTPFFNTMNYLKNYLDCKFGITTCSNDAEEYEEFGNAFIKEKFLNFCVSFEDELCKLIDSLKENKQTNNSSQSH